jgi:hypothetical protein
MHITFRPDKFKGGDYLVTIGSVLRMILKRRIHFKDEDSIQTAQDRKWWASENNAMNVRVP